MKFFDHDDRRWMEGTHDGRWFALSEDGTRLVMESSRRSVGCFVGETADAFTGQRVGVLGSAERALAWMFESDPSVEPANVDREHPQRITVALDEPVAAC